MKRADQRKFHYIYKITRNDGSGKFYIGMHSTDDLDDGYFGSGQRLWKSINKHGKEKHSKEILEFLPSRKELKDRERELVNEELLGDKCCMNLKLGGDGGWDHIDTRGDKNPMRRAEVVEKVRAKAINPSVELRKLRSENMKRIRADMLIEPRVGKKHTDASKALMSVNRQGKGGWSKGLKLGPNSAETRERKRLAALVRSATRDMGELSRGKIKILKEVICPHCDLVGKGPNMTRFHFGKCKRNPNKA
jgi:hypothetical protein